MLKSEKGKAALNKLTKERKQAFFPDIEKSGEVLKEDIEGFVNKNYSRIIEKY